MSAILCVLSVVPLFEFFLSDFNIKSIYFIFRGQCLNYFKNVHLLLYGLFQD